MSDKVKNREQYHPSWDERTAKIISSVLGDFKFRDKRLETHPTFHATLTIEFRGNRVLQTSCKQPEMGWWPLKAPEAYRRSNRARKRFMDETMYPKDLTTSPELEVYWSGDELRSNRDSESYLNSMAKERSFEYKHTFAVDVAFLRRATFGVLEFGSRTIGFSRDDDSEGQLLADLIAYIYARTDRASEHFQSTTFQRLGRAFQSVRKDFGLSQVALSQRMNQSRVALSQSEKGRQTPSLGPLFEWCRGSDVLASIDRLTIKTVDVTFKLRQLLKEDPKKLRKLTPSQFEQFVVGRLDAMGSDVTLTGHTNKSDGGIDLVAVPKIRTAASFLLAGQMRHHRKDLKTGRAAVDRLLAWRNSSFKLALLVTNTEFTRHARWLAMQAGNRSFLRLRDIEDLKRWL